MRTKAVPVHRHDQQGGLAVRAPAARRDRGRRGDRRRGRQAAASQDRQQAREAGGGDHPDRRRGPDTRLPAFGGREGRTRRDPRSRRSSARPRATTYRPSRPPSPTRNRRWPPKAAEAGLSVVARSRRQPTECAPISPRNLRPSAVLNVRKRHLFKLDVGEPLGHHPDEGTIGRAFITATREQLMTIGWVSNRSSGVSGHLPRRLECPPGACPAPPGPACAPARRGREVAAPAAPSSGPSARQRTRAG